MRTCHVHPWFCAENTFHYFALLTACLALLPFDSAMAVPANPEPREITQPDGAKFQLLLRGDEFFSWHETVDGYAVAKDADGFWKFAQPALDRAAFVPIPEAKVGSTDPAPYGVSIQALPALPLLRALILLQQQAVRGSPVQISNPPPDGLPPQPPPSPIPVSGTKTIKNIVILACFSDHWDSGNGTVLSTQGRVTVSEYSDLFNQVGYTTDGAVGSVRDYYKEVSYGKLTVQSVIVPWVRLPQNEASYGANSSGSDVNPQQMVLDAINAAATAAILTATVGSIA